MGGRADPTLGHADATRGPEPEEGLPDQVLLRYRTEEARVGRVAPVVPHHEVVTFWYLGRAVGRLHVPEPVIDVGLPLPKAVDVEPARPDLDGIPRQSDDALDQGLFPTFGALEEHDVSALRLGEVVGQLVDQDPIPHHERRDHALRADVERRSDHGADEAEDQRERDQQYDRDLQEGLVGGAPALVLSGGFSTHARAGCRYDPAARSARTPRPLCSSWVQGRRSASRGNSPGYLPS